MAVVREGAVWLTVDEVIQIIGVLNDPRFLENLNGRHRQRLKMTIEELEEKLRKADGTSIYMDVAHLNNVLRFLRSTQDWLLDLLDWLDGVG